MKHFAIQYCGLAQTFIACALLTSCSPVSVAPNLGAPAAPYELDAAGQSLYAFSPGMPLVATYRDGVNDASPTSVLEGSRTKLAFGNGMAVDSDGTIYVVVEASESKGMYLKLLVFAPGARGNVEPERTARLNGGLLPGYAVGLALDGHGNLWLSDIGKLARYSTSAGGRARPNLSIALQLITPKGFMAAHASNVAIDLMGNVYCSCTVVYQGNQAIGVSEYSVATRKPKLVRSFYDFALPEVPPSTIAIDRGGTIYLASSLPNTGVFAYGPKTKSGHVHYTRRFTSGSGTRVTSITTDSSGDVYLAAGTRIMVFGPGANGHVRPLRSINDPKHLDYTTDDYGTLLSVY